MSARRAVFTTLFDDYIELEIIRLINVGYRYYEQMSEQQKKSVNKQQQELRKKEQIAASKDPYATAKYPTQFQMGQLNGGSKNNKNHYRKISKKRKSKKNKKCKTRSKRKYRSRRKQSKM